jgi:hypothetical protein
MIELDPYNSLLKNYFYKDFTILLYFLATDSQAGLRRDVGGPRILREGTRFAAGGLRSHSKIAAQESALARAGSVLLYEPIPLNLS